MDPIKTTRLDGFAAMAPNRLRFAGELEQEFLAAHLQRARPRARLWQLLELAAVPAMAVVYAGARGGEWPAAVSISLAVAGAVSIVLLAAALWRFDERGYLRTAVWLTPLRSMAFCVVIAHFVGSAGAGTAVLTASTFGHFFFAGLMFRHSLMAAAAMSVTYLAALLWYEVPASLMIYSITTICAVQTMAAVVAFDAQRAARVAFLEHGAARSKARHDALTGLRNRRDFDERLDAYWRQAMAAAEPLTVLMIDIDHFKAYNDHYGHQAGDEVLRRVARAVRVAARSSDVVARFGGEEFVMLAPGLDEPAAAALGERIRATVEQLGIAHEASGCAPVVTVCVGAAHVFPRAGRSPAGALQLADENLYRAKNGGRNGFVLHGGDYDTLRTGRFRQSG